jgi:hypothetical protein
LSFANKNQTLIKNLIKGGGKLVDPKAKSSVIFLFKINTEKLIVFKNLAISTLFDV